MYNLLIFLVITIIGIILYQRLKIGYSLENDYETNKITQWLKEYDIQVSQE